MPAAPLAAALALAQIAATDTVVTISAGSRGLDRWVDLLTSISSMVIALALIALSVALIPAAWHTRKIYKRINDAIEETHTRFRPILHHVEAVSDNVNYISTALRSDVERLQASVVAAQKRLDRTVAQTEERIGEFNALLGVVQQEAEELFIHTASTLRGVRAGAHALNDPLAPEWDDDDLLDDDLDDLDLADDLGGPRDHL